MLRPRVLVLAASLLATATVQLANAQRVEVAARIGYSPPTGTLFQVAHPGVVYRSWDGGGLSVGAVASYWLLAHFGIQGTGALLFTRHHVVGDTSSCFGPPGCGLPGPPPIDAGATQVVASLRIAARQALGNQLQVSASVGPAVIHFGDAQYQPSEPSQSQPSIPMDVALASRTAYGVAGGLSAAFACSSRLRLTLSADDMVFRVRPAAVPICCVPSGGFTTVVARLQHEFTFSALVGAWVW
jgi:hypothetical protein